MKIKEIKKEEFLNVCNDNKKNTLNSFLSGSNFLQSHHWSDIQSENGKKVYFFVTENDGGDLLSYFIAIEESFLKNKKYLYIPRGPVVLAKNFPWSDFFLSFKGAAKEKGLSFIRFEPLLGVKFSDISNIPGIKKSRDIQPSKTLFLDLKPEEDAILKQMSQKTRYNIRLSIKKRIEVFERDVSSFDDFWKLISITAKRDGFFIHKKDYYYNLIKHNKAVRFFEARFQDKILAFSICSFYGDTVTYLHGASSNEMRNKMAPYAIQWEVIKKAKKEVFLYYDFYGINKDKWPGVSRFKKGFGGSEVSLLGTFDFLYEKNFYFIYKIARKVRRFLRFLW
jgi:peptidoglycan pentaglycine glycine transferase (the first glycine)